MISIFENENTEKPVGIKRKGRNSYMIVHGKQNVGGVHQEQTGNKDGIKHNEI